MRSPIIERQAPHPSTDELRARHTGPVLAPGDDGYDAARQAWNAMVDKRPAIVAQPDDVLDVAAAIAHARQYELEIGVKCGGHGILGQAIPEGGLQIDLSRLNAVRIHPDKRLAYVQGGALLGDLDRASTEHRPGHHGGERVAHRRRRADAGRRDGLAGAAVRDGLRQRDRRSRWSPPTAAC